MEETGGMTGNDGSEGTQCISSMESSAVIVRVEETQNCSLHSLSEGRTGLGINMKM